MRALAPARCIPHANACPKIIPRNAQATRDPFGIAEKDPCGGTYLKRKNAGAKAQIFVNLNGPTEVVP
jgi:hypothetical protein